MNNNPQQREYLDQVTGSEYATDINPYEVPKLIWDYVEPYMKKYDVIFTEMAPKEFDEKPVVIWKTKLRSPGFDGLRKEFRYTRGGPVENGRMAQYFMAYYTCQIEFRIVGNSSSIIDRLAWDLEQAVLYSEGRISYHYPGFKIWFLQQIDDSLWAQKRPEDQVRVLQFKINCPVTFQRYYAEVKELKIALFGSGTAYVDQTFVNSDSSTFQITSTTGEKIHSIVTIKRSLTGNHKQLLYPGIDYDLKYDPLSGSYVVWNSNGSIPDIGETFWVSYVTEKQVFEKDIT